MVGSGVLADKKQKRAAQAALFYARHFPRSIIPLVGAAAISHRDISKKPRPTGRGSERSSKKALLGPLA
jgi:hypothetical protein